MSKDALGWRCKFAVVAPSTNTIVQPDMDDFRVDGVTNHFGRIYVPNMKVGNDDEFVAGKKEQEPIYSAQLHVIRRFSPGFWASLNFNYYTGGRQTIDGVQLGDTQRNSRLGATFVFPVAQGHAIKVGYAVGWLTRFGADFDQFLVTYSRVLN